MTMIIPWQFVISTFLSAQPMGIEPHQRLVSAAIRSELLWKRSDASTEWVSESTITAVVLPGQFVAYCSRELDLCRAHAIYDGALGPNELGGTRATYPRGLPERAAVHRAADQFLSRLENPKERDLHHFSFWLRTGSRAELEAYFARLQPRRLPDLLVWLKGRFKHADTGIDLLMVPCFDDDHPEIRVSAIGRSTKLIAFSYRWSQHEKAWVFTAASRSLLPGPSQDDLFAATDHQLIQRIRCAVVDFRK